ncbi:porin [Amphritea sp. 1_MG-2023]|uniref:porin n=1 Tax=Amphritea sp. 1_MG-2023 TaxID=3062670 RepID=UPI0026E28409|nr:porin [Amphritea sp. 1_MG-2023]MDO6563838.1 porin [Amphritea sp. 1_MG-2023]
MKKSLIALAVAGALTAPMVAQADATLYGSLRVQATDADGADLHIGDNTSRIGIKATSELYSGVTAIAHFETYVSTETGSLDSTYVDVNDSDAVKSKGRLAYVGATGDFGTVTVGRQWIPAYLWTVAKTDIMAAANTETTHNYGTGARQGNTAAYVTPSFGGFQAAAAIVARNSNGVDAQDTDDNVDATHLAAQYNMGNFAVALSTLQYKGTVDENINSLGLSYSAGDVYVGLSVEDDEVNRTGDDSIVVLAGSYTMGNTTLLGSYTDFRDDVAGADQGKRYIAEVQQKLGKQAFVFANYIEASSDAETAGEATDTFAIGYNVSF